MSRAFCCPGKSQRNRNDFPDLLRAMPLKVSAKDGRIPQLNDDEKEVEIVDAKNGFGFEKCSICLTLSVLPVISCRHTISSFVLFAS